LTPRRIPAPYDWHFESHSESVLAARAVKMLQNRNMMNAIRSLALLLLLPAPLVSAESGEPVGMVLLTTGDGYIDRGGQKEAAQLAALLYAGDRLVTTTGKLTFLFCPTTEQLEVQEGSRVLLDSLTWRQEEGPLPIAKAAGRCALPRVALGQESLERVGGLRPRGYPPVAIYLGGPISSPHPRFEWAAVDDAEKYQLWIRNDRGRVVWEAQTAETSLQYSESEPMLEEGRYTWEVQARKGTEVLAQQSAWFEIKPNPELWHRELEGPAEMLIHAASLEEEGYFAEAADLFRRLRDEQDAEDPRLTSRIAWLYWNAGLMRASVEEQERLDRLEAAGKRP
jgi:hypothetical protein